MSDFRGKLILPKLASVTSPQAGELYYDTDNNRVYYYNGTDWKVFPIVAISSLSYTWTIPDEVKVPSGDNNYIPGIFAAEAATDAISLISCRHRINSGTSATVKLQVNGTDATGFTGISVTTTSTTTNPADVPLADEDYIQPVVTAVVGTPKNMTLSVYFSRWTTLG